MIKLIRSKGSTANLLFICVLNLLINNPVNGASWKEAEKLPSPTAAHNSILLNDGKVLLLLGTTTPGFSPKSYIYDPKTNSWSDDIPRNFARSYQSAVKLNDGRVLAAGGNNNGAQEECEIYNPETNLWTIAGSLKTARHSFQLITLKNGKVLAITGNGNGSPSPLPFCEIFNPLTETWTTTGGLSTNRDNCRAVLLNSGKVLVTGGTNPNAITACEIYDPETGIWSFTDSVTYERTRHSLTLLKDGKVLVAGGGPDILPCELYNPETGKWTTTGSTISARRSHLASLLDNGKVLLTGGLGLSADSLNTCELFDPDLGTWSTTASMQFGRYAHTAILISKYEILVTGGLTGIQAGQIDKLSSVEIFSINSKPTIEASGSPTELKLGESVSFTAEASDADNDTLTFDWNFGDGTESTEQNPSHTYSAIGTYTATATVTDTEGDTATDSVEIKVLGGAPTARFTTSTVVGFVNVPLTFDGTLSTDPENNIASYSWNFGDESPAGTEKTISKIYSSTGSYTVKLTITDGEGQTNTASRQIEVLSKEASGSFNAKVEFNVRLNFKKESKDSFKLLANVNIGTQEVASGTTVKVEFAGNTFTGVLDTKLQDKSDKNEKWKVKANTNKQAAGEVKIQLKVKKANLAASFQEAGVTPGDDPKEEFELELPIIITIGDRTIETTLDSTFKFNKKATKAKGSGELE